MSYCAACYMQSCHDRMYNRLVIYYAMLCYYDNEGIYAYEVSPSDMETYDSTLWRLWDWGYTRILPKEKFELVKPYIRD